VKPRHAAALALVGWYHRCSVGILPIHETPRPEDSTDQPRILDWWSEMRQRWRKWRIFLASRYVPTDDPRLKGK
jgi:hypothetical protein